MKTIVLKGPNITTLDQKVSQRTMNIWTCNILIDVRSTDTSVVAKGKEGTSYVGIPEDVRIDGKE